MCFFLFHSFYYYQCVLSMNMFKKEEHNTFWLKEIMTWACQYIKPIIELFHVVYFSAQVNPSFLKRQNLPYFYFNDNGTEPNSIDAVKQNFISLVTSGLVPPPLCLINPQCTKENTEVYAGMEGKLGSLQGNVVHLPCQAKLIEYSFDFISTFETTSCHYNLFRTKRRQHDLVLTSCYVLLSRTVFINDKHKIHFVFVQRLVCVLFWHSY